MTAYAHSLHMDWSFPCEDDLRFKRILKKCLIASLVLSIVLPILPLSEIKKIFEEELPPRMATLIFEKENIIKPKPIPVINKKVVVKKKISKPVKHKQVTPRKVNKVVNARKQAEKSGLLALTDSLADMRQNTVASSLKTRSLSHSGGTAKKVDRSILTAGTTSSSNGINTSGMSRNTGGGSLAGRSTTQIQSLAGNASGGGRVGESSRRAGRSIEEIQMIFDQNKGSIYSVYNRALRKDPTLQGKIVLELTIAPSGVVTACALVSSELHDATLGQKISHRVKLFNFGAKDVNTVTITYPIDFLPA